jgi:opacity protein-like surface antigen
MVTSGAAGNVDTGSPPAEKEEAMRLKSLIIASLAVLAAGAGRPASADLKLLEPYGGIYSGRTLLGSPADKRPKDAQQNQTARMENIRQAFVVSPLFADSDGNGGDLTSLGGTVAYANSANQRHPWQLQGSGLNNHIHVGRVGSADLSQFDVTGKYVLLQPTSRSLPVVSIVGRWSDFQDLGARYDLLLAADQAIGHHMFATANVGWARSTCNCGGDSALVAGLGLTYAITRNLSLSADYTFSNAVDDSDLWTVAASYSFSRNSLVRVGGGKNSTLGQNSNLIFANYVLKVNFR